MRLSSVRGIEALAQTTAIHTGFTLVELLVVVAIIGLLAVIAIPNFLEAQIRAKVGRAQSELRTMALAAEAYAVDHNGYPTAADEKGEAIVPYPPIGLGPEAFETRISVSITTPVAYIAARPTDPFAARGPDPEDPRVVEGPGYHYGLRDYALANDGPEGEEKFMEFVRMYGGQPQTIRYFVSSHGPDLDHDDDEEWTDIHAAVPYDPTNGSVSSGDLVYLGPAGGFGR